MMNFSEQREDNTVSRKVFLGKRSFKIAAVNPSEDWLKENKFYINENEFARVGTMQTKNKADGVKNRFAKIDVFVKDVFDGPDSPFFKVSYMLQERYNMSNDGSKCQIINKYGNTLWVPTAEARTLTISHPFIGDSVYVLDGIKPCLVGEEALVGFIRSLRNLNNVRDTTSQEDRAKLASMFDKKDLDKMFLGDFKDISALLNHGDTTVGFLLGAKTSDKGSVYQDFYKEKPLRPYEVKSDKDSYLIDKVNKEQAASRYSSTYFDLQNLNFREYVSTNDATKPTDKEDLFAGSSVSNGLGFGAAEAADPFGPTSGGFGSSQETVTGPKEVTRLEPEYTMEGETDDLPF